ncbi:MAG: hypothetical protein KTR31_41125 [Myxococcales bacterium]|nr:hypothetical protein [Myxococcales bacterium]
MSFEERQTWIHGVVTALVCGAYFVAMGVLASRGEVAQIAYGRWLLAAMGVSVALHVALTVASMVANPDDGDRSDERDETIERRSLGVGLWALVAGGLGAMALGLAEVAHFWVVNAIFAGFVGMTLVQAVVKIQMYRRGF